MLISAGILLRGSAECEDQTLFWRSWRRKSAAQVHWWIGASIIHIHIHFKSSYTLCSTRGVAEQSGIRQTAPTLGAHELYASNLNQQVITEEEDDIFNHGLDISWQPYSKLLTFDQLKYKYRLLFDIRWRESQSLQWHLRIHKIRLQQISLLFAGKLLVSWIFLTQLPRTRHFAHRVCV